MQRYQKLILVLYPVLSFLSCNRAAKEPYENRTMADNIPANFVSSSAAVETGKDSSRKFIRTADLKFKVKAVIPSTYDIEDITNRQGGFVIYTDLSSHVDNITTIPVSADSSLETVYYTVTNTITLRVPNTRLDSTLKEISRNIDYLDHRVIKAEDVALQIHSNDLAEKRNAKNKARLMNAIDNRGKKLIETTVAEEILLSRQTEADNATISNLSLTDQVKFSTIHLFIYQRQEIKRELISNNKNIHAYEPGFGSKILEAMKMGWEILESIIVFLAKLWGFFIIGFAVYLLYKHQSKIVTANKPENK